MIAVPVTKFLSETTLTGESWYIPHHKVNYKAKDHILFNSSFQYRGLNGYCVVQHWVPPCWVYSFILGSTVLLSVAENAVAHSEEGRNPWGMQVAGRYFDLGLLAVFVVHPGLTHSLLEEDIRFQRCIYLDNCLQSFPLATETCHLLNKLRELIATRGASN